MQLMSCVFFQSGVPPPPLGSYVQPGPPPGMYQAQPLPGSYTGPAGGYQTGQPPVANYPPPPPQQTYYFSSYTPSSVGGMQSLIPIMPMGVAVTLCVINCILPGIGEFNTSNTVKSSLSRMIYTGNNCVDKPKCLY